MNKKHIVAWSLILFAFGCLGWKNPFTDKIKEGNTLFHQEKYEEALKEYLDAQVDNPESEALHFNIGNVLFKQKKYKEAAEEYQKAGQSQDITTQAMAYYNLGNCKFRENDLPGAIKEYKKALSLNSQDREAKFNLELARRKLKETAQQKQQNENQQHDSQSAQQDPNQNQQHGSQSAQQDPNQNQQHGSQSAQQDPNQNQQHGSQSAQQDPNQQSVPVKPHEKNQKDGQEMSKEDALRILQALQDRENKELKYISPPAKEREFIEYDW